MSDSNNQEGNARPNISYADQDGNFADPTPEEYAPYGFRRLGPWPWQQQPQSLQPWQLGPPIPQRPVQPQTSRTNTVREGTPSPVDRGSPRMYNSPDRLNTQWINQSAPTLHPAATPQRSSSFRRRITDLLTRSPTPPQFSNSYAEQQITPAVPAQFSSVRHERSAAPSPAHPIRTSSTRRSRSPETLREAPGIRINGETEDLPLALLSALRDQDAYFRQLESHEQNGDFKCPECDHSTKSFSQFLNHSINVHKIKSPFSCPICSAKPKTVFLYTTHLQKAHARVFQHMELHYKDGRYVRGPRD